MDIFDVAVIGLGAMGSAALRSLARRGKRVVGLEQFEPGHDRGSSHGESRLIRLAYVEGEAYVPLLKAAVPLWRELEEQAGKRIFTQAGVLEMGYHGSAHVAASLASARRHDLACEELTPAEVRARFPAYDPPDDWDCIFQPDGGVLEPEKAIRHSVRLAEALGAEVRLGAPAAAPEPIGDHLRITMADGPIIEAGSVIVSAGAWLTTLYPELSARVGLELTAQQLFWFDPVDRDLVQPDRMPAFAMEAGRGFFYGLPDMGHGVKAAIHERGTPLTDPDAPRPQANAEDLAIVQEQLRLYVPAAAGAVRPSVACTYTNTPDGHFFIDRHPDDPRIVIASPCSGHGFKFAVIIGEILADLATVGETGYPIDLFRLR